MTPQRVDFGKNISYYYSDLKTEAVVSKTIWIDSPKVDFGKNISYYHFDLKNRGNRVQNRLH